jgi:hypothetical protein
VVIPIALWQIPTYTKQSKAIYEADLDGNAVRGTFHDQIEQVLEKDQFKSARHRRVAIIIKNIQLL